MKEKVSKSFGLTCIYVFICVKTHSVAHFSTLTRLAAGYYETVKLCAEVRRVGTFCDISSATLSELLRWMVIKSLADTENQLSPSMPMHLFAFWHCIYDYLWNGVVVKNQTLTATWTWCEEKKQCMHVPMQYALCTPTQRLKAQRYAQHPGAIIVYISIYKNK